jgi:hypothetical protein
MAVGEGLVGRAVAVGLVRGSGYAAPPVSVGRNAEGLVGNGEGTTVGVLVGICGIIKLKANIPGKRTCNPILSRRIMSGSAPIIQ